MDFWHYLSERKIEEAQKAGDLDTAAYRGKRLDLTENPFIPEDQRLAYKLLKDNDLTPAWVGDGKDIRQSISVSINQLEAAHNVFQDTLNKPDTRSGAEAIYARIAAYDAWDAACARFRTSGQCINNLIKAYNLRVPLSQLQRLYFNVERELDRIQNDR